MAFLRALFLKNVFAFSSNSTGYLLFICNYAVVIIKYSTPIAGTSYFIFGSCCKNRRGITDNPFGFSILLQFADIFPVERYTEEACNIANAVYFNHISRFSFH